MLKRLKEKKKSFFIIGGAIICAVLLCIFLLLKYGIARLDNSCILTVETPQKLSASETDIFTLDVTISSLGDVIYPAASMSITFDSSRLEFLGIEEGNVFITSESSSGQALPEWSYNTDACNKSGKINVMYLDMTGGKNAFTNDLLAEEDNVVLRLMFRLRGSIRAGDVCDLIIEDAVFAASNEEESIATSTGTLKTKNGKLVIGE